jgi:hypothetical protein
MMKTNKMQGGTMNISDYSSALCVAWGRAILAIIGLFSIALCPLPLHAAEVTTSVERQRQELIEIMKGVNFAPQLGEDNPICKTFYEDFKKQMNIEYIQPIVKADSYDDPVLKPYQEKCPTLKMHKTMTFEPRDIELAGEPADEKDAESRALGIYYGMGNFQLYKVDINNHPEDGEEFMIYYEGRWDKKHDQKYPDTRAYQAFDLKHCKAIPYGADDQGGSTQGTRSGVIRYKGKNAIYILRQESSLHLYSYSERLKRTAPTCTYYKSR